MSERTGFNRMTEAEDRELQACQTWSVLLPDAAEGLLAAAEQSALDRHVAGCAGCARELADAQRGAAWLHMLKDHAPEPPASLLSSILAKTSEADADALFPAELTAASPISGSFGAGLPAAWIPAMRESGTQGSEGFRERLGRWFGVSGGFIPALQPRLAMTAAMAFFSICVTLNLLGVSVRNLNAEAIHPAAGLQRTVADTGATLVRSFEGIRVVYRLESRVNEWRTASAAQTEAPLGTAQ